MPDGGVSCKRRKSIYAALDPFRLNSAYSAAICVPGGFSSTSPGTAVSESADGLSSLMPTRNYAA